MKISLSWLREWVEPGCAAATLGQRLTLAGFELEGLAPAAPAFSGVVVGEIVAAEQHPNADKLRVCLVSAGGEPVQVVCGAPNARAGIKVPFATVGAVLPGGLNIKQAKLRGIDSHGMLCSAAELGLSTERNGLMELPAALAAGQCFREALDLDDVVLELNLTPNRGDALSVRGVSREVAVLLDKPLCSHQPAAVDAVHADTFPVSLSAPDACPRFLGRVLQGLNPAAVTPGWMIERLRRAGVRGISPTVDVTNYVMLELGQPMHVYDLARLSGGIQVRWAAAAEKLVLLDGSEIELAADELVIADATGPVALAGVMGGDRSGILPGETTNVFLEVAWFAPAAIAGRARRHGLHTDAAQRFERGVDPALQANAMERATALLLEICGGSPGPVVAAEDDAKLPLRAPVVLRRNRLDRVLGIAVPAARVESILVALGMQVAGSSDGWQVLPPSWRFDVAIEEDLIEEVARVFGYDAIPEQDAPVPQVFPALSERRLPRERLMNRLVDLGYQEAITYSFVEPGLQTTLFPGTAALTLANPISADLAQMRVSLWPGLIRALKENQSRQQANARLFEMGSRFDMSTGSLVEIPSLAGLLAGDVALEQWADKTRAADFFDLKGDVEAVIAAGTLLQPADISALQFVPAALPCLHPGRSARLEKAGKPIGWLGELHPRLQQELSLTAAPLLFELDLDALLDAELPHYREISRFPAVRRDLALVVAEGVAMETLLSHVKVAARGFLQSVTVFDVYRGQGVKKGLKSVALALVLQDTSRTLTDDDVESTVSTVIERLKQQAGAELRE